MAKKNKIQNTFLDELRKMPIVLVACEKSGVSRNSIYRWRKEDKKFSEEMDKALAEGEDLVNDLSESQLLTLIKEKNFSAVRYWLSHRNPKFKDKVEVTTKVDINDEELTPEQQAVVHKAFNLASIIPIVNDKQDEKEKH
ncbi:DUF1804 family protein [Patescibacteria group bacterium]|nr:DUF1804 family protein [Patescibacteria group bacterium]